jgi:hypothetical protein
MGSSLGRIIAGSDGQAAEIKAVSDDSVPDIRCHIDYFVCPAVNAYSLSVNIALFAQQKPRNFCNNASVSDIYLSRWQAQA